MMDLRVSTKRLRAGSRYEPRCNTDVSTSVTRVRATVDLPRKVRAVDAAEHLVFVLPSRYA